VREKCNYIAVSKAYFETRTGLGPGLRLEENPDLRKPGPGLEKNPDSCLKKHGLDF
jgi:hypothetical protein